MTMSTLFVRALGASVMMSAHSLAQDLTAVQLTGGLSQPLYITSAPGDPDRLYILQKTGKIRVYNIQTETLSAESFLELSGVETVGESGLVGLAFHPDFAANRRFFINYNRTPDRWTVIAEYQALDADHADPGSARVVRLVPRGANSQFHRAGWMGFRPGEPNLYCNLGDDQKPDDAQSLQTVNGKILRIDIDAPDAFPEDPDRNFSIPADNPFIGQTPFEEIWMMGMRNPYRGSFDRATGDFYFGDVGGMLWEEVNFVSASSAGGLNFGWPTTEGPFDQAQFPQFTHPIHAFAHDFGNAVIGGYVYRGSAIAGLDGTYFFADITAKRLYSFRYDGSQVTEFRNWTTQLTPTGALNSISTFGEDHYGELYVTDLNRGRLYKFIPTSFVSDCDADLIEDADEIASGAERDCNGNGVLDDCESICAADLAPPLGVLNLFDFLAFQTAFGLESPCADLAAPFGTLNLFDFLAFQTAFGNGC